MWWCTTGHRHQNQSTTTRVSGPTPAKWGHARSLRATDTDSYRRCCWWTHSLDLLTTTGQSSFLFFYDYRSCTRGLSHLHCAAADADQLWDLITYARRRRCMVLGHVNKFCQRPGLRYLVLWVIWRTGYSVHTDLVVWLAYIDSKVIEKIRAALWWAVYSEWCVVVMFMTGLL